MPRGFGYRLPGLLPAVLVLALAAPPAFADVTVVDAGGRSVAVKDDKHIASLGGDVTEILYALGLKDRIVAIDTTSLYPPEALKEKKNVGYMRALSTEGVLSTGASLIVASVRCGPPEVVKALKAASVPYVEIADTFDAKGIGEKIRLIARTTGVEAAGESLAAKVEQDFADLAQARTAVTRPARMLFVISNLNGRVVVGGKGTAADAIIRLVGGENAAGDINGFKPLVDEAVLELAPDAILVMQQNASDPVAPLAALPGVKMTPAAKTNRIFAVDGAATLNFGPRAPREAKALMARVYPAAAGGK